MQSALQHRWTGLYLLLMALGALCLFLYGFFPLKYHTGQISHWNDMPTQIEEVIIDGQSVYNPGDTSVVLMVIDGLRYDFVTEEYMPYTGQALKNKSACIYVSVAEPPTVTMPRIKSPERKKEKAQWKRTMNFWRDIFAMMTGSVSTFADVALNFGAPAVKGDSVLRAARSRDKRSVMFGDDTWLRLFPGLWAESDGTTSFYVTDYTEVDNNVTRHLDKILTPDEKNKPTFDFMVLHYLGLDHIGHLEGARSPKIKPKLKEMDDIIQKIYKAMEKWDHAGVLFVCGDHGMRDAGGHGGSTPAEVLVPLVVMKTNDYACPYDGGRGPTVAQVDMAPSVAWLLNSPVPGDSTGRILPSLLPHDTTQHLYLLHYLAEHNGKAVREQLGEVAKDKEFYKQYQRARQQFAHYLSTGQRSAARIARDFYTESLQLMSQYLAAATVHFDMFAIVTALVLLYAVTATLICVTLYSLQREDRKRRYSTSGHQRRSRAGAAVAFIIVLSLSLVVLTLACAIAETKSNLCSLNPVWMLIFVGIAAAFTLSFFLTKAAIEENFNFSSLEELNAIDYLLIGGTLFHSWSFFGTSFIEEEHMTWYFFWNTLMFFVLIRTVVVVVMYLSKVCSGATEVQEKPQFAKTFNAGIDILPKWILLIALHRYLRTMNQTGDRWLFLPDTADWLNAPENSLYLEMHLIVGTLLTLVICLRNLKYTNNVMQFHSAFTIIATGAILCYRIATKSLVSPFPEMKSWDTIVIVDVFWGVLVAQMIFEILTYIGKVKCCSSETGRTDANNKFVYNKPKAKVEDFICDPEYDEPWNNEDVKLNLVRSLTHLVLNDMMLIIVLLMRPHNVIMVPSIYVTCKLTSQCLDHKLLDTKPGRRTEVLDVLSQTLVHLWIGAVFFFYQGNSNSLASVDLGAGYVGLRQYCPARVALRMGLHAYAAPALAGATLYCTLAARATDYRSYLQSVWQTTNIFALQRVYQLCVYSVVATVFRHHLFVWTVFSPKLLYDFVSTVFTVQALLTIAEIIGLTHFTSWIAKTVTYKTNL